MLDDPRGNAHGGRSRRHICQDYRVGANFGVLPDPQWADDLRTGAYVDVPFEGRHTSRRLPDRDLVKQQTVRADLRIRMNNDAVRMGQEQAASQLAIQWNISARDHRPPAMSEHCEPAQPSATYTCGIEEPLIVANARQKGTRGCPFKRGFLFPRPVRDIGGHGRALGIVAVATRPQEWIIDSRGIHPCKIWLFTARTIR